MSNDPKDPVCNGCGKRPYEIEAYRWACMEDEDTPVSDGQVTAYVIFEEGTYNPTNGHFLCDPCYITAGMPSSPTGWKAP